MTTENPSTTLIPMLTPREALIECLAQVVESDHEAHVMAYAVNRVKTYGWKLPEGSTGKESEPVSMATCIEASDAFDSRLREALTQAFDAGKKAGKATACLHQIAEPQKFTGDSEMRRAFEIEHGQHWEDPDWRHETGIWASAWHKAAAVAQPAAQGLDIPDSPHLGDHWKAALLDGRALERDENGMGWHPALPSFDEATDTRKFYEAFGMEICQVSAESELEWEEYERLAGFDPTGEFNFSEWKPKAPDGEGWKLVCIHDTEDGPYAWWLRAADLDKQGEPDGQ